MTIKTIHGRVHIVFDDRGEVVEYEPHHDDRGFRAMMLATTPEVYEALLRGDRVPLDRLDPEQVTRFGRRAA